jgi:hypothetical protein
MRRNVLPPVSLGMGHGIEDRLVHDAPLQVEVCRRHAKSVVHGDSKSALEPSIDSMLRIPLFPHVLFDLFLQLSFRQFLVRAPLVSPNIFVHFHGLFTAWAAQCTDVVLHHDVHAILRSHDGITDRAEVDAVHDRGRPLLETKEASRYFVPALQAEHLDVAWVGTRLVVGILCGTPCGPAAGTLCGRP